MIVKENKSLTLAGTSYFDSIFKNNSSANYGSAIHWYNNSLNVSYELSEWEKQGGSNDTIYLKIYNILGKLVYNESKVAYQRPKISYSIDASNFRSGT